MIQIERLHPSEFDLLKDVDDGFTPDPDKNVVVVARNEDHIIGRIFLIAPAHVEGVFVEHAWRKGPILKNLVQAIELEAKCEGIKTLLAFAKDETMEDYISRLGYKRTPLTVWRKELI